MQRGPFDMLSAINSLQKILKYRPDLSQIPFLPFIQLLQLGRLLGVAFSDVQQKIAAFEANNRTFPNYPGFYSFIEMEMKGNIHVLNGENNGKYKASKQFKEYNSTARNLLRMMWFLTFVRVAFQTLHQEQSREMSLSDILNKAYVTAFADKHGFFVRQGAKLAMMAAGSRQEMMQAISPNNPESLIREFVAKLIPVHQSLWGYYRKYNLVDLQ